jgi:hypothetical protein
LDRNLLLTVISVTLLVLLGLHVTDDMVHGLDTVGPWNMIGIVVAGFLLYATLALRRRLAGLIVMLLISIFAVGMPIIHLRGASIQDITRSSGGFFFLWTLWALGVAGTCGLILSIEQLWRRRAKPSDGDASAA